MAQQDNESVLLSAPVPKLLLGMTVPIGLAMLSTFLFQVVDTYFVGQLGPSALAALGFSATTYFLGVALFMGLATGVSSLVANAIGTGDKELGRRYATVAVGVSVLAAIAFAILGIVTIKPLFSLLGAAPELLPLIDDYMGTLYLGMPLLVFGLAGDATIRSTGDVRTTAIIMGLSGVVNVILDYLLIFGVGPFPRLELQGAALATLVSWVFVFVCILLVLLRRRLLTTRLEKTRQLLKEIIRLSTPAVATQIMLPLTAMFVVYLAAKSGPEVVAAIGVATRIETLLLVGISSVCVAIVPFVAQNYGANKRDRVDEGIVFAGKASIYWGGGMLLVLVTLAGPIAKLFTSDAAIVGHTKLYFYIIAVSYGAFGIVAATSAIFNGMMKVREALKVLLTKTIVFTVPLVIVGSFFSATGIFIGIALSNILGAIYARHSMNLSLEREDSSLVGANVIDSYVEDITRFTGKTEAKE